MTSNDYVAIEAWIDNKHVEFKAKKLLNASEADVLFERIITSVYDEDGEYMPQYFEYIWRRGVIEAYTDFVMPEDTDEAYLCCYSELWDSVLNHIAYDQLNDIRSAVDSHILQKEQRICFGMQFKELMNDINTITQAMLNFEHLPEWLAESLDDSVMPLTKKAKK